MTFFLLNMFYGACSNQIINFFRGPFKKNYNMYSSISVEHTKYIVQYSYYIILCYINIGACGGIVVKALPYKPAGRGFDSRCCYWNFSVT